MSNTRMWPYENTIAFGGVATGNINAKDVAMAADVIKYSGLIPTEMAWRSYVLLQILASFLQK